MYNIANSPDTIQIAQEIRREKRLQPSKIGSLVNKIIQEKDLLKASDLTIVYDTLRNKIKEVKKETSGWGVFFKKIFSGSFRKEVREKRQSIVLMRGASEKILEMLRSKDFDRSDVSIPDAPPLPMGGILPSTRLETAGRVTEKPFDPIEGKKVQGVGLGNDEELLRKLEKRKELEGNK